MPITLENNRVKLSPLTLDNYSHLITIGSEPNLVQYSPSKVDTPKDLKAYVETALEWQDNNTAIPFIVFDKAVNAYAGTSRYMNISWHHSVLEIGATWIGRKFQGTDLNMNMKFLMLQHAFETLNFDKVEFRVDERNMASRKAVEKIGGILEGILRKNVLLTDGFKRNTCCYGILNEEWKGLKTTIFKGF
ncbi:N-acetyltransferase [Hyunsoonleella flava]|uniref:N-acetyltransferase n=1 Tax=Hyunsoonleella flava TaxID=2527939 RepID=A0A4Q9FEK7_9FLAO|nr:GNAT family protein [Hyunsoonleella flava]TBN04438.1 N-acetyltransferase [Hyunsoonleella flava]